MPQSEFHIGDRRIGDDFAPFIIAEAGINHEGDFDKAIELIDAAKEAGADCIKFQSHITEAEMIPTDMKPADISDELLWDIIKRCELTEEQEHEIKKYCENHDIIYLCTPFSREAADRLERLGVAGYKIGSGECNNIPLLRHIAAKGMPMILSTGMNDLASIKRSVAVILEYDVPLLVNHCVSEYPTPYEDMQIDTVGVLRSELNLPIGISDHSLGIYSTLGAVALGAVAVEKHFTISRSWPGPDTGLSIEPDELKDLVQGSEIIWKSKGVRDKIHPAEQPVIEFAYASVVAIADVKAGEQLTRDNIWVKRPGTGPILAPEFESVLGKTALTDISTNTQLSPELFN
jgi:sialic acid synthase SpsE